MCIHAVPLRTDAILLLFTSLTGSHTAKNVVTNDITIIATNNPVGN
jgi:hypothetical protein